jgi:hypothetical protein
VSKVINGTDTTTNQQQNEINHPDTTSNLPEIENELHDKKLEYEQNQ